MATHVGTSGVVKVGANTVAEVTGFTLTKHKIQLRILA